MSDDYILTGSKVVEIEVLVRATSKEDALRKAEAGEALHTEVLCEHGLEFDGEILTQYEYLEKRGELDDDE